MNFKITPLILFIILLLVLFLSIIFVNKLNLEEGFISYNKDESVLNQLYVKQYSTTNLVYKLYDSIYYDSINGNVIELFGEPFDETNNETLDTEGSSLTDIVLMNRSATANTPMKISYYDNKTSELSVDTTMISKSIINNYNYSIIPDNSNYNLNRNINYNYQLLYISYGQDTILHIYDCTNINNVNIGSYLFRQSYDPLHYMYRGNLTSPIGSYIEDRDQFNNTYVKEILYDKNKQNSLFQLSKNVLFDTSCRYLIVRKKGHLFVYDGTINRDNLSPNLIAESDIEHTPSNIVMSNFRKFQVLYIPDPDGSNFILYIAIPSTKKTVIAILSMDEVVPGFLKIRNVVTFNQESVNRNGLDGNDTVLPQPSNDPYVEAEAKDIEKCIDASPVQQDEVNENVNEIPSLDSIISDYYSKYWNNNLPVTSINGIKQYSNDFLLKTQIVPPICPSCNTNVSCNSCGRPPIDISNNNFTPQIPKQETLLIQKQEPLPKEEPLPIPKEEPLPQPISEPTPVQNSVMKIGSSITDVYKEQPKEQPTFDKKIVPQGIIDPYSYYGALPTKPTSDYMPVTSDFSKFGN
jgi:hypothetical protein